jgi:hypothetical protein
MDSGEGDRGIGTRLLPARSHKSLQFQDRGSSLARQPLDFIMLDLPGALAERGARECIALWTAINCTSRYATVPNRFIWPWATSGVYSVSSTYDLLMQGTLL